MFLVLVVATFARHEARAAARQKSLSDWIIDLLGLSVQGTMVPILQATAGFALMSAVAPQLRGALHITPLSAFLLNVVVVDYLYYWNHRAMHSRALWAVHFVHHTPTSMDVFATSRNTLWTSALIVYLWVNGAMLYLLADPWPFAAGAALTAALDLWRHSPLQPPTPVARLLSPWLILPEDHARHHASDAPYGNFAANLKLWDKLHGTYLADTSAPEALGLRNPLPIVHTLLWPFR